MVHILLWIFITICAILFICFSSYSAFEQKLLENDFVSFIVNHPVQLKLSQLGLQLAAGPFGWVWQKWRWPKKLSWTQKRRQSKKEDNLHNEVNIKRTMTIQMKTTPKWKTISTFHIEDDQKIKTTLKTKRNPKSEGDPKMKVNPQMRTSMPEPQTVTNRAWLFW